MESKKRLETILEIRSAMLNPEVRRRLSESTDIIVFGSFASGLETSKSDLDVFCTGTSKLHFKLPAIEILILPEHDLFSTIWLGSELAAHISSFGVPIGNSPEWLTLTQLAGEAVRRKEERIAAYTRSLANHWGALSNGSKSRFQLKLRREIQRLRLLRLGKAVPPTRSLDLDFEKESINETELLEPLSAAQRKAVRALYPTLGKALEAVVPQR